ncbi:SpoVR family protein [Shigella flexneri]
MNQGWATFWHYTFLTICMTRKSHQRSMMEFLHSHTNVVFQPAYNSPWYSGINPYVLGFAMFQDIKRICQSRNSGHLLVPRFAGSDWLETLHFAMRDFKDEKLYQPVHVAEKDQRDFRFTHRMMTAYSPAHPSPSTMKRAIARFARACHPSTT